MIRIKIVQPPAIKGIDGIRLDCFQLGLEYEVGNSVGALLLAEGWAEPIPLDAARPPVPFGPGDPFEMRVLDHADPPNLKKEPESPFWEREIAADAAKRTPPR